MSATDSYERVCDGFKALLANLRQPDDAGDAKRRADMNETARTAALARVRDEYAAAGIEQPHELALSLPARRELGYPIPQPEREDVA